MSRSTPTISDVVARLMAVRLLVRGLDGAMPSLAKDMRREACESIDDIIRDLAPYEKGAPR
jgi:hypothetical protein